MKKFRLYSEAAYLIGLVVLALGTAFMERADFGMSMVVAPAYLVYRMVSRTFAWFTFGMAEYCFQAFLLVVLSLVMGKFRKKYLFSFVTAVLYGGILDGMMRLAGGLPKNGMGLRVLYYIVGMLLCALGVSLLFHTYLAPEAYELFVKEVAGKYRKDISKVKTLYDCTSCLLAILMSFLFFGFGTFEGVKLGTVLCALVNGWLIGCCSSFMDKRVEYKNAFSKIKKIG